MTRTRRIGRSVTVAISARTGDGLPLLRETPLGESIDGLDLDIDCYGPPQAAFLAADATEVAVEIVSGRDVSANFDMQSLASLLHGDRILVQRSEHSVRFLHPLGWNYFATLRKKLRCEASGISIQNEPGIGYRLVRLEE